MTIKTKKVIASAAALKVSDDGFIIVLSAARKIIVAGQSLKKVPVGWEVQLPKTKYGRVTNLNSAYGNVLSGTLFVEEDYVPAGKETTLEVTVRNHGSYPITIILGQEIASLQVLTKPPSIGIETVKAFEVETEETDDNETNE